MGDLYASAVGTTVLQLKEIPPLPSHFNGKLCLYGLVEGINEAAIMDALAPLGAVSCELGSAEVVRCGLDAFVCFDTHESALTAKRAGPIAGVCASLDTQYNERPYDERGW